MNNEAPAVAFFHFKRQDGFEVALTLRGESGKDLLTKIDAAIELVKSQGATPVTRYQKKEAAPKEYADYPCPICNARVVKVATKNGKNMEKCETQKYINGVTSGCSYTKWL